MGLDLPSKKRASKGSFFNERRHLYERTPLQSVPALESKNAVNILTKGLRSKCITYISHAGS